MALQRVTLILSFETFYLEHNYVSQKRLVLYAEAVINLDQSPDSNMDLPATSCQSKPAKGRKPLHANNELPATNEGVCKTVVETQGYTCEEHKVTTEDGYILSMQRMRVGRSGKTADKPPVLLQHGLFVDGVTWLLNPPDESLAFILTDNGFDVWVTNIRGTKYSREHRSLGPNDMAYWDWSWDELASYDLPASVQYVYNHTGQKMHYVGHSMGTLMIMAALSQNQLLNMLRSAALLSPIAHMHHITSLPAKLVADLFLANDVYWLGLREFIPNEGVAVKFLEDICHRLNVDCSHLMDILTGPNCCFNSSVIDAFLNHEPQPTATKNLIHFSQMIRTGVVAKYNYVSPMHNMLHYGQLRPPIYDMTSIPNEFPLFISYGGQDLLSDVQDVEILLNDLQNHEKDKLVVVFREEYAHLDFIMGINAKQIVYDPMMAFFRSHC